MFWVFHSHSKARARIHREECLFCRSGQGLKKGPRPTDEWSGPFDGLDDAEDFMLDLFRDRRRADKYYCSHCLSYCKRPARP